MPVVHSSFISVLTKDYKIKTFLDFSSIALAYPPIDFEEELVKVCNINIDSDMPTAQTTVTPKMLMDIIFVVEKYANIGTWPADMEDAIAKQLDNLMELCDNWNNIAIINLYTRKYYIPSRRL